MTNMLETEPRYKIENDIGIFDNLIPPELCDEFLMYHEFVQKNNFNIKHTINRISDHSLLISRDERVIGPEEMNFLDKSEATKTYFSMNGTRFLQINSYINDMLETYISKYPSLLNIVSRGDLYLQSVHTQKTIPGQGYHLWHHDGDGERIMTFITYLNDDYTGGETEFLNKSMRIEPKKGRTIIFPGAYTHSHRGNPPLTGEKYIATGWITYREHIDHGVKFGE